MKVSPLRSPRFMRFAALLALLAISFQLVALEIGNFHAAERLAQAGAALEICTPLGMKWITPEGEELPVEHSQSVTPNCPYCVASASPPLLLVVAFSFLLPSQQAVVPPPATPDQIFPEPPDLHQAPRAPPVLFA